jgi:hypothetical protein
MTGGSIVGVSSARGTSQSAGTSATASAIGRDTRSATGGGSDPIRCGEVGGRGLPVGTGGGLEGSILGASAAGRGGGRARKGVAATGSGRGGGLARSTPAAGGRGADSVRGSTAGRGPGSLLGTTEEPNGFEPAEPGLVAEVATCGPFGDGRPSTFGMVPASGFTPTCASGSMGTGFLHLRHGTVPFRARRTRTTSSPTVNSVEHA